MHSISYYENLLMKKNKERNKEVDTERFWDSRAEHFQTHRISRRN